MHLSLIALLAAIQNPAPSLTSSYGVPSVRKQAEVRESILQEKLDRILPRAMRANGFDMWIVIGHSVGNNSHDIGARIAEDIPFAYGERVRFPLVEGEFVSVEFHVSTPIPEWGGKTWYARLEENARVGPKGVEWLVPRQDQLILIRKR